MSYIAAEDILEAKNMDLLTFLRDYEPQELIHVSENNYCTIEHDSLRISNGKWCWFSQGIGGRSALDYLIKVKGFSFPQAVEAKLRCRAFGRRDHCACLHHLLPLCCVAAHRQDRRRGRNDGVELYWGTHLQHAHPGQFREDVRPDRSGDDGTVNGYSAVLRTAVVK